MIRLNAGSSIGHQWANYIGNLADTTNPFSIDQSSEQLAPNALTEAGSWLTGVSELDSQLLGVTATAKEARPHGAFPDEGAARPIDEAVTSYNNAVVMLEGSAFVNVGRAGDYITNVLEEFTGLATHENLLDNDGDLQSAPLYTFLPKDAAMPMLAALTFALGELAVTQKEHRVALDYLDLLDAELPNEPRTDELKSLRMVMHVYKGRALSRLDRVMRSVQHFQAAINTSVPETHHHVMVLETVHAEIISNRFKLALECLERNDPKGSDKQIEGILSHRRDVEKLLERSANTLNGVAKEKAKDFLINLRSELGRHFWYLGLFDRAYGELHGIQLKYGSDEGANRLRKIIDGYGKEESSDTTFNGRMLFRMGRWYRLATGREFTAKRAEKIYRSFCDADGSLKHPDSLKKGGLWKTLKPALKFARWRRPREALIDTFVGGFAAGLSYYLMRGGSVTAPGTVQAVAGGAVLFASGHRLWNGLRDPRAKDQANLGVDTLGGLSALGSATRAFAPVALTYTVLGGSIPGLGVMSDLPGLRAVLEASPDSVLAAGSFPGAGPFVAGISNSVGNIGHSLADLAFDQNTSPIVENLQQIRRGTFVSVTESGLLTGYTDIGRALGDGRIADRFAAAGFGRNPLMSALGVAELASLAGLFAWRLSGDLQEYIKKDPMGRRIGWIALPFGILGAAHMSTFLGAKPGYDWNFLGLVQLGDLGPLHLPWKMVLGASIAGGFQAIQQRLTGVDWKSLTTPTIVNKALLRAMVAGVAVNFIPHIPSETLLDKMVEGGAKYMNVLPLLYGYGLMNMTNWRRYIQAKFASVIFFKPFQYGLSLAVLNDFAHPGAIAVRTGIELVTAPWQNGIANDTAGTEPTKLSYRQDLDDADGEATDKVMAKLQRGLFRLPWDSPIRRWSRDSILSPYHALASYFWRKRIPGRLLPEESNWAMLYRMMTEEGFLSEKHIATLLKAFERVAPQKENADMARGLAYIIAAASSGWHQEQIVGFMKTRRAQFAEFGIGKDLPELPDILPTDSKRSENKKKKEQATKIYRFMMDERRSHLTHHMPQIGDAFGRRRHLKAVKAPEGTSRITREMKPIADSDLTGETAVIDERAGASSGNPGTPETPPAP